MATTRFQAEVLKLIASSRVAQGASYIAGGLALNHQLKQSRLSSDIDIFNDSSEAMTRAAERDIAVLAAAGYEIRKNRHNQYMVDATVTNGEECTDLQWVIDSAFRFFPLVTDDLLGYTLHPFDLAINKLLALEGRRVPRDWVDVIACCEGIQPLAYLIWAANGKDQGVTPFYLLDVASQVRYSKMEFERAIRAEAQIDGAALSMKWKWMISAARLTLTLLPPEEVGKVVLDKEGRLFRGSDEELAVALDKGEIIFHEGTIRGAWPTVVEPAPEGESV